MTDYQDEFPKAENMYLKAQSFQDQNVPLTYIGWRKIPNQDLPPREGKAGISWKQRLKYQLRYSYPEFALDEAGETRTTDKGEPIKNRNFDPAHPHGYAIEYAFEEGKLQSGSLPLWNTFCIVRPKKGDRVLITRLGKDKETIWKIKKIEAEKPVDFSSPEYSGNPDDQEPNEEDILY